MAQDRKLLTFCHTVPPLSPHPALASSKNCEPTFAALIINVQQAPFTASHRFHKSSRVAQDTPSILEISFVNMAPKKKGNKKGNDEWEADLGETPDPIAAAAQEAKEAEAAQDAAPDEASGGGGGLLAALKKNKSNKKKKGKVVEEDYVDGEDPPAVGSLNGHPEPDGIQNLATKAPEEATTEDLFEEQAAKAKGGKSKQGKKDVTGVSNEDGDRDDAEDGGAGGIKSKKEKEKEKKEREKARKKEQVRTFLNVSPESVGTHRDGSSSLACDLPGCCEEETRRRASGTKGGACEARSRSEDRGCSSCRLRKGKQKEVTPRPSSTPETTGALEETARGASKGRCRGKSPDRRRGAISGRGGKEKRRGSRAEEGEGQREERAAQERGQIDDTSPTGSASTE